MNFPDKYSEETNCELRFNITKAKLFIFKLMYNLLIIWHMNHSDLVLKAVVWILWLFKVMSSNPNAVIMKHFLK